MIKDQNIRKKSVDPSTSFILKAPAGSGKTHLLMQRFLNLIANQNNPENILAITFTRDATQEMLTRIRYHLKGLLKPASESQQTQDPRDQEWVAQIRAGINPNWDYWQHSNRFSIMTFDELAQKLQSDKPSYHPFGEHYELLSAAQSLHFYEQAAEKALIHTLETPSLKAQAQLAVHLYNGNHSQVIEVVAEMLSKRDRWQSFLPLMLKQNPQQNHQLYQMQQPVLNRWQDLFQESLEDSLSIISPADLSTLSQILELKPPLLYQAFPNLLLTKQKALRKSLTAKHFDQFSNHFSLSYNSTSEQFKDLKEWLKYMNEAPSAQRADALKSIYELMEIEPEIAESSSSFKESIDYQKALLTLSTQAYIQLKGAFIQSAKQDFLEAKINVRQALRCPENNNELSELGQIVSQKWHHLLVDEFQDTAPIDYQIIQSLTSTWDGTHNSFFFVGDPMQSIYRFRQAEPSIFNHLFKNIKSKGHWQNMEAQAGALTTNFRSHPDLITWFNDTFSGLFSKSTDWISSVRYIPKTLPDLPPSDHSSPSSSRIQCWITPKGEGAYETLLDCIKQVQASSQSSDKIAVLFKTRNQVQDFIPLLEKNKISLIAHQLKKLSKSIFSQDCLVLLRLLHDPSDDFYFKALLRSHWFGLSITTLAYLNDFSLLSTYLPAELDQADQQCVLHCQNWVLTLLHQKKRHAWADLLRLAFYSLADLMKINDDNLNEQSILLGLLTKYEALALPFDLIELELDKQFNDYRFSSPESPLEPIVLMTIHGAKGLEFETVMVPFINKITRTNKTNSKAKRLYFWLDPEHANSMMIAANETIKKHGLLEAFAYQEKNNETEESCRLFYVAATRARNSLILLATPSDNQKDLNKSPSLSRLTELEPQFQPIEAQSINSNENLPIKSLDFPKAPKPAYLSRFMNPLALSTQANHTAQNLQGLDYSVPRAFENPLHASFSSKDTGIFLHRIMGIIHQYWQINPNKEALWQMLQEDKNLWEALDKTSPKQAAYYRKQAQIIINNMMNHPECKALFNLKNCIFELNITSKQGKQSFVDILAEDSENSCLLLIDFKFNQLHSDEKLSDFSARMLQTHQAQLNDYHKQLKIHYTDSLIKPLLLFPLIPLILPLEEGIL